MIKLQKYRYLIISVKPLIFISFILSAGMLKSQEIGYLSGITKQGIQPEAFQPLYGFTLGAKINKFIAIETAFYYSQRSIVNNIQADYITFMAMPKIGYFGKKAGIYYSPAIALNPTLHHSNPENHTYLSTIQSIGGQINIVPEIILDIKIGYDFGITGAYYENGAYQNYSGGIVFIGLKYAIRKCE